MQWPLFAILAGLLLYAIWIFNRFVSLRNRARNAWSDIDVQLKRRWELVPALVSTVRGYAAHEAATLERVTEARARAVEADTVEQRQITEQDVSKEMGRLLAVVEDYPDLKADELFHSLHEQLVVVEDHLQSARRYYNAVVRDFNTLLETFPHRLVAGGLGFRPRAFFRLDDPAQAAAPAVDLEGRT
ncbi:MAG: LemA family protein [Phycisphaerae bacterium]|nr:LemA family protein [Phycisphaerae bacterium]